MVALLLSGVKILLSRLATRNIILQTDSFGAEFNSITHRRMEKVN